MSGGAVRRVRGLIHRQSSGFLSRSRSVALRLSSRAWRHAARPRLISNVAAQLPFGLIGPRQATRRLIQIREYDSLPVEPSGPGPHPR